MRNECALDCKFYYNIASAGILEMSRVWEMRGEKASSKWSYPWDLIPGNEKGLIIWPYFATFFCDIQNQVGASTQVRKTM